MIAVDKNEPTLIKRYCGGWLAVAPKGASLRIGVTSATEEGAVEKYKQALAEWEATLAQRYVPHD